MADVPPPPPAATAADDPDTGPQPQFSQDFEVSIAANTVKDFAVNKKEELVEYGDSELTLIMRDAVTKFNIKPKACRDFLIAKKVIQGLPSEFAAFILDQPKISKRRIGEYIGSVDTLNQLVCEQLFSKYDFRGDTLDAALRKLLYQFRLPGEAQQIDRILEKFATHYHRQNDGVFLNSDTAYVLSFSIIMLNTDLHNQAILPDKKMTLDQFVRNNRGINQGQDVDREILERLYKDIKENEIRMDEGDMYENEVVAFMAPTKSGWLQKKTQSFLRQWRNQWFVLNDGCLYYFHKPGEPKPRCIIPLDNTRIGRGAVDTDFVISSISGDLVKSSKFLEDGSSELGCHPEFVLRASSAEERELWVKLLHEESNRFKPLHEIFLKRKEQDTANKLEEQLPIPRPIAQGWMRKRGDSSTGWKRRYFVLFPDFDYGGITLFYYVNQQVAQKMIDHGTQTQQGYMRASHITDIYLVEDMEQRFSHIEVVTEDRVWCFAPDELDHIEYWSQHLKAATVHYIRNSTTPS